VLESRPQISVIMAVWNAQRYLGQCLRSMSRQTVSDYEFIIVDDGSTDGSRGLLERWARKDRRIRLIARENRGLTRSLNEALAVARGDYIARMDADDISLPNRFELQIDYLARAPECVAVGSEVLLIDPEGWPIAPRGHDQTHDEICRKLLQGNGGAMSHPAVIVRASVLRAIGGYDERFAVAQDFDLFLRLAEVGQLANLPEVLLLWRQSKQSVNQTRHAQWNEVKRMALQNAMERRGIQLDIQAILAADQRPSQTPRLAWGRAALNCGHPWTALKNGCISHFGENSGTAAQVLIRDALSHLYWREFREKVRGIIPFWKKRDP
jgi:hypothetical protein